MKKSKDKEKRRVKVEAANRSKTLKEKFEKEREEQANQMLLKACQFVWASQNACLQFLLRLNEVRLSEKIKFFRMKRQLECARIIKKQFHQHKAETGLSSRDKDTLWLIQ